MKHLTAKKIISMLLALVMIIGVVTVNSVAAQNTSLFTLSDVTAKHGDEFEITITFNREISKHHDPIAALDISLEYDSDVYTFISMENGQGLIDAFNSITSDETTLDKGDYIFTSGTEKLGVIKWSLITLDSFNFTKDSEFMKVRFKTTDTSDLSKDLNFTIKVTNAAEPNTLKDITDKFGPYTNNVSIEYNPAIFSEWEFDTLLGGYKLVKYSGDQPVVILPSVFDDPSDDRGLLPVVSVGSNAFRDCKSVEKVVLGKNVIYIGSAAFMYCENLTSLVVFSETAFFGLSSLYGTSESLVIKCVEDSTADLYAQLNRIDCEYFDYVSDWTFTGTDEEIYYTGAPIEFSDFKAYNADNELMTYGVDYSLEYSDNIEIGTAKVLVKASGEHLGSKEIEFDILCPYHTVESDYYTETPIYANCEDSGVLIKDCTYCGYHDTEAIDAKGHGECEWIADPDSTCTEVGVEYYICHDCTKALDTREVPKKDHVKSEEWTVILDPTCTEKGLEVVYCENCDYIFEEDNRDIDPLSHNYVTTEIKEPTCQEDGLKADVCERCKDKINEVAVPQLEDHVLEWVTITKSTCKEAGEESWKCRFCEYTDNAYENKPIEALGCEAGEWVITIPATCTIDGNKEQRCTRCNELLDEDIVESEGHQFGDEWFIDTDATCETDGVEFRNCANCIEKDTRVIEATGHTAGETIEIPKTCTEDGLIKTPCANCDKILHEEELIATGHITQRKTDVLPTYKTQGRDKLVCDVCHEITEYITVDQLTADVDGDGRTTSFDALLILQHSTGLTVLEGEQLKKADFDGSGSPNSADALLALQIATGLLTV